MNDFQNKKNAYHHGDLRSTLFQIGQEELEQKGAKAFSLREVSKKAGVSHMAAYRHFKNKDELLISLAKGGFATLAADLEQAVTGGSTYPEKLIEAGVAYLQFALRSRQLFQLMFGSYFSSAVFADELKEVTEKTLQSLFTLVQVGVREKSFSQTESPQTLAYAAWSLVHGVATLVQSNHLKSKDLDEDGSRRLLQNLAGVLLKGMLASA